MNDITTHNLTINGELATASIGTIKDDNGNEMVFFTHMTTNLIEAGIKVEDLGKDILPKGLKKITLTEYLSASVEPQMGRKRT